MIKLNYDDGKEHIHVLSFGGGTQSTALTLYALEHGINGVKPDYIIFSDTGWEPENVYEWVDKINNYIKERYDKEIIIINKKNIRDDILKGVETGSRFASMPFFTKSETGEKGMIRRQCTEEYKIEPVNQKIRELLGYKPRQMIREMVHVWKGISIDEIHRVKPIQSRWQTAEHPLVDDLWWDRSKCIHYVESLGLGTPVKSSCIGCPFHDNNMWRDLKINDPKSFADAVYIDQSIRNLERMNGECYLHQSRIPLDQVDFAIDQMDIFEMLGECEGMCGV
ncbi:TPA: phosphoadenosine phosphosulfate reductase family protein [Bacillus thuringiensis]|nr:phosphoadenosine phosphosulfate reductase family protein [Bacillus cereus]HDR4799611.1 phosphoadenosine phosphosulfate reductase family protein [Bacillus cereus]HDR4805702.1 phosphoadenosine phosphosulfate reductase family protein [Bacillus cereus]HDR4811673.1 phosphoadenosine phosphosulfate reductase family protein [Bacillus cereus]HDR4834124.1 phosphoadenosine phosphosulfate reductase family protein [Bacillus cereus]